MSAAMATAPETVLANIHQYAAKARESHERPMDLDVSGTEDRLTNTIRELQEQVDKQRAALETVSYLKSPSVVAYFADGPSYAPRTMLI